MLKKKKTTGTIITLTQAYTTCRQLEKSDNTLAGQ